MIKKVSEKNILKEVQSVGFDASYLEYGIKKHKFLSFKIFDLKPQQASIIKQAALSCGCDCAVNRGVLDCSAQKSDCILSGSVAQLENVAQKLEKQQFSLFKVAEEIKNAINSSLTMQKPKIMGILNLSSDSFSDGYPDFESAIKQAEILINDRADIIDIGAESTRPGAKSVCAKEQIEKITPVIKKLAGKIPLSVDTTSSEVAKAALDLGADIINDASFLSDNKMLETVIKANKKFVLMHSRGIPETMDSLAEYGNVADEIYKEIYEKAEFALERGFKKENLIVDLGFGFAKTVEQNLELIKHIDDFKAMGFEILAGISRKRTIKNFAKTDNNNELDFLTSLSTFYFVLEGVDIIRVHNVEMAQQAVNFAQKLV